MHTAKQFRTVCIKLQRASNQDEFECEAIPRPNVSIKRQGQHSELSVKQAANKEKSACHRHNTYTEDCYHVSIISSDRVAAYCDDSIRSSRDYFSFLGYLNAGSRQTHELFDGYSAFPDQHPHGQFRNGEAHLNLSCSRFQPRKMLLMTNELLQVNIMRSEKTRRLEFFYQYVQAEQPAGESVASHMQLLPRVPRTRIR
jgi:hypothetical protein